MNNRCLYSNSTFTRKEDMTHYGYKNDENLTNRTADKDKTATQRYSGLNDQSYYTNQTNVHNIKLGGHDLST
jgi:hypothetical protein